MSTDTEIRKGTVIANNDPRCVGHQATILGLVAEVGTVYAAYQAGTRKARIRLDRIHTDGKQRRTGWSFVRQSE